MTKGTFISKKLKYHTLSTALDAISLVRCSRHSVALLVTPFPMYDIEVLPRPTWNNYFQFKALNNSAPKYISDLLSIKQCRYPLRSATSTLLIVPRSRTTHYGDRAFEHFAPLLWNKLPNEIRGITCLKTFQAKIKELLFLQSYK